ncbi:MAG TPA: hypothetical protein VFP80_10875 [Thermoanaerobaculia bacterium]|nr:hypothetical protein [Thermoanaerobaculia bacterium]
MRLTRLVIAGLSLIALNVLGQGVTVTPDSMTLVPGQSMSYSVSGADNTTLTAASTDTAVAGVADNTVTARKQGSATIQLKRDTAVVASINVTVEAFGRIVLECPRCDRDFVESEVRTVTVAGFTDDGERVESVVFTIVPADSSVVKADGNKLTAAANVTGRKETTLSIKVGTEEVATIPAVVHEAISSIEAASEVRIQEDDVSDARIVLAGRHGSRFLPSERRLAIRANPLVQLTEKGQLQAFPLPGDELQNASITLVSDEGLGATEVPETINVSVIPRPALVKFSPGSLTLTPGRVGTIQALLYDRDGRTVPNAVADWSIVTPGGDKFLLLSEAKDTVTVQWKSTPDPRPDYVELKATVRSGNLGDAVEETVLVRLLPFPTRFAELDVRLTLIDEQMAADLFGSVTAREYHVARVRLNNNLRNDDGTLLGSSILAFSESIETAVKYQKRPFSKKRRHRDDEWVALQQSEIDEAYLAGLEPKRSRFSALSMLQGIPGVTAATLRTRQPTCSGSIIYRPYSFDMMVNSVDRRDERSTRARIFRALNAIATLGSSVTAVGVGAKSDLPLVLEKYGNLFIPGMERIWPSLRETERQNIINETMKPIEEIPYGSDLNRTIFFPKGPFRGIVMDQEVRIATICPYYFVIEVAVLDKDARFEAGQTLPGGGTQQPPP